MAKTLVHAGEDVNPACCRCIPTVCAADDSGDHCASQACGVCLHGCPAPVEAQCCLPAAGRAVMPLVAELAELRKWAGVPQARLGRLLGLSRFGQAIVSRWETGTAVPAVGHAAAYAHAFGHRVVVLGPDGTVVGGLLKVWPRLPELRRAAGLSQQDMARVMFVGQTAVQRVEKRVATAGTGAAMSTAVRYLGTLGLTAALHPEVAS